MTLYSTENEYTSKSARTLGIKTFWLSFIVILPNIMTGFVQSYTAVALPQMKLNLDEATSFSALSNAAAPIGSILFSLVIDIYGRKIALVSGTLPYALGWILIYLNYNKSSIFIGRMLTGFSTQSQLYSTRVYLIECLAIDHIRLRSFLLICVSLTATCGSLMVYILGYCFDYLQLAAFASSFSFLSLLLNFSLLPESPTWLYLQGRNGDAELAQRQLNILQPLLPKSRVNDNFPILERNNLTFSNFIAAIKKIIRKDVYKPLIIMSIITSLSVATGGFALVAYMVDVINSGKSDSFLSSMSMVAKNPADSESYNYGLISAIIALTAQVAQSSLVPYFGARTVTVTTCCSLCVGLCILGSVDIIDQGNGRLFLWHVAAVWLVIFIFYFGVQSVPMAVIGEVFPADVKGVAGVPICTMSIMMAVMVKIHPYLYQYYGGYQYYIYAAVAVTEAVVVFLFMPETVGKTLEQINREFLMW